MNFCHSLRRVGDNKLVLAGVLLVWLSINLGAYAALGVFQSGYFSFGPSERLLFMQTPIDTWTKWSILIAFRVAGTLIEVAVGDMLGPWIITRLQDEDKKTLPYRRWQCKLIVQIFFGYHDINSMFSVFLALTQVDVALVVIVSQSLILQCWTLPRWLAAKRFVGDDDDDSSLLLSGAT
jgi:hypothetical protein